MTGLRLLAAVNTARLANVAAEARAGYVPVEESAWLARAEAELKRFDSAHDYHPRKRVEIEKTDRECPECFTRSGHHQTECTKRRRP